jgi:hypothetical protein
MTGQAAKSFLASNLKRLVPHPCNKWAEKHGYDVKRMYAWRAGEEPDAATLASLARDLHVSVDDLLSPPPNQGPAPGVSSSAIPIVGRAAASLLASEPAGAAGQTVNLEIQGMVISITIKPKLPESKPKGG